MNNSSDVVLVIILVIVGIVFFILELVLFFRLLSATKKINDDKSISELYDLVNDLKKEYEMTNKIQTVEEKED